MKTIALLLPNSYLFSYNYFRQFITEKGDSCWNNIEFVVNPERGNFDGVIVHQSTKALDKIYQLNCPKTRTLLVLKEPPDILYLPESYTRQFYCTLGPDRRVKSTVNQYSYGAHHWFVEINLIDIPKVNELPKIKLLSAVISNKTDTIAHRERLNFMYELKKYFGDQLDWFGRGIKDLGNKKLDGLANYKYHIVLENGSWKHYWTEKLADAFVSNCFPFYWGCPNILDYFEPEALKIIDIKDIKKSIKIIEKSITSNLWETRQIALERARNKIIYEYHPYKISIDLLNSFPESEPSEVVIKPHTYFKHDLTTRLQQKINRFFTYK